MVGTESHGSSMIAELPRKKAVRLFYLADNIMPITARMSRRFCKKKTFQIDDHHEGDFHNIIDFTPDNGGPGLITIDGGSSIDTLPRKVLIAGRGIMSSLPQLISVSLGGSENLFNSLNCGLSQYQVKIEQAI